MKKIFLLLAVMLSVFTGYAQNNTYLKSTMVVIVSEAKTTYTKGISYNDWVKAQIGTSIPTIEETNILKDIYGFLSTKQNPESVFKNYNGTSLSAVVGNKKSVASLSDTNRRPFWFSFILYLIVDLELFGPNP